MTERGFGAIPDLTKRKPQQAKTFGPVTRMRTTEISRRRALLKRRAKMMLIRTRPT